MKNSLQEQKKFVDYFLFIWTFLMFIFELKAAGLA